MHEAEVKRQQVETDLANRENLARQRQKIPLKGEHDDQERYGRGVGGLRRSLSHSSPNIAKMMDEEDAAESGMGYAQRFRPHFSNILAHYSSSNFLYPSKV